MLTEVVQYLGGALVLLVVVLRVRAKRSDRKRDKRERRVARPPHEGGLH